jgi:hypothetical protein
LLKLGSNCRCHSSATTFASMCTCVGGLCDFPLMTCVGSVVGVEGIFGTMGTPTKPQCHIFFQKNNKIP